MLRPRKLDLYSGGEKGGNLFLRRERQQMKGQVEIYPFSNFFITSLVWTRKILKRAHFEIIRINVPH